MVASTIANANGGKKSGGAFTAGDFFPRLKPPVVPRQTAAQSLQMWEMIAASTPKEP